MLILLGIKLKYGRVQLTLILGATHKGGYENDKH